MTMFRLFLLLCVSAAYASTVNPRKTYEGWRVLEIVLEDDDVDDDILQELHDMSDPSYMEILRARRDKGVAEVAVSPAAHEDLRRRQLENKLTYNTLISDLSKKLEVNSASLRAETLPTGSVTFDRYMDIEEIEAHVENLPILYPGRVTVKNVGSSVENRPIYLVSVTSTNKKSGTKPIVFIDAGIHAREWITPSAALHIIEQLVDAPALIKDIEWQIIPMLNPDGYAYSWTNDRLWRKNRAPVSFQCYGTDLNRNFGFHWGEAGSSSNQCSSIYRGSRAFSEPESMALKNAISAVKDRVHAYITLHSYGQYILHPWGYTTARTRFNDGQLYAVGDGMANAIKKYDGTTYNVGSAAKLLYPAAGGSDDWVAGELKVALVYTFELRDEGVGGFLLPESQIRPAANDAWLSMRYLGRQLIKVKGLKANATGFTEPTIRQAVASQQPASPVRLPVVIPEPVPSQTKPNSPEKPLALVPIPVRSQPKPAQAAVQRPPVRRPQQSRPTWGDSSEENSSEESRSDEDSDEDKK